MGASLLSGVSGLRSHQMLLDVVANNLANVNTPGYKTSRFRFADLFAQTIQTSTAPTSTMGGKNPIQIGLGVRSAGVDADMGQGSLSTTGRTFDMAIQGNGFFVVSDGVQDFYTRVGAFDVDSANNLVDLGTGFRVQDITGADIIIPYNETRPGQATSLIHIAGNLNATAENPAAEVLTASNPFQLAAATVIGANMGKATIVGSVQGPTWNINDGDTLDISVDGAAPPTTVTFNVAVDGAATWAEVQAAFAGVSGLSVASVNNYVVLQSDTAGGATDLQITDGAAAPGAELGITTATATFEGDTWNLDNGDALTISVDGSTPPTAVAFTVATDGYATATEISTALTAATANGVTCAARDHALVIKSASTGSTSALQFTDGAGNPVAAIGLTTNTVDKTASGTTDLRDLATTTVAYQDGATISVLGTDYGGANVNATFTFGTGNDGTTLADLAAVIDTAYTGSTAAVSATGDLTLTANTEGDASLALTLDNASGTGATTWAQHDMRVVTNGSSGATRATSISMFDELGTSHVISLTFRKQGDNEWRLEANCADATMLDSLVEGIMFNDDGSFKTVTGTGEGDLGIALQFGGSSGQQAIFFDFGESGSSTNLTQFGGQSSATATDQNGFGSGSLSAVSIRTDGTIQGNFTNGEIIDIAQLQVATFSNPGGLEKIGDNFFLPTTNSGAPVTGAAQQGGAGMIAANTLEGSNVDIALEFTRLITAQRGFQVNARVITTADAILQELANIIR